jgi:peptidoglycan hydrolase CwlO-like protein
MGKKNAHVGKMEAELKAWGAKLDDLVAKAEEIGAEAKSDYHKGIDDLKAKYKVAQSKLDEIKNTGDDNWETLKGGVEHAWKDLEGAFKKLKL